MRSFICCIVVGCALSGVCSAQTDISRLDSFSASPEAIIRAFDDIKPGTDVATVLSEDARFDYDASGLRTLHHRTIVKILTKAGAEQWSTMESSWAPWEDERPVLRARIISPDASVREIDPATIADTPVKNESGDILSDRRTLRAPLPAVEPGSIIEEEVIERQTRRTLETGDVESFYLGFNVPVRHTHVEIHGPESIPFRLKKLLLPDAVVRDETRNGLREIAIDQGPMKALGDVPPLLPPDEPLSPHIAFSTGKDWGTIAAEYNTVIDRQLQGFDATSYLPKFAPSASRDEKARAIVEKLNKEIRYTGIEFAESTMVPHKPSEVIDHKFGDCKDTATLAVAMLRAAGVQAYVALLRSSSGPDIHPELPGLGMFNHAIVYAPGTPDIWLDLTDPDLRIGVVSPPNQGRYALIARATTTELIRTPETTADDNRVVETREFRLPEFGRAHITETSETWGTRDRDYRGSFGDRDDKTLREDLKDYIGYAYGEAKIASITAANPDDLSKPYSLRLELDDAQRGAADQTEAVAAIFPAHAAGNLPDFFLEAPNDEQKKEEAEHGPRTQDFLVPTAWTEEFRYRIVAPKGFRAGQLPAATDEQWGPGKLSTSYKKESDTEVTAVIRFTMAKRRFTAKEGLALRDGVLELKKRESVMIHFDQVGEADLASGDIRGAIREFTALKEQHPNEALHSLQMARAFLAAGAGEAARAEGRKAVEREQGSASGWAQLAEIYKNDLVGRPMEPGFDRDAAVAAYRKALELDPSDDGSRLNLAILLEYNPAGVRYGPGSKLDESIGEYAKILDKLENMGAGRNYPIALFRAGRARELRTFLTGKADDDTNLTLRLCATAMLDGAKAAVEQAPGGAARQRILASAGQTLITVRRYDLAADLMEAAAVGAPNPAAVTNVVQILRRSKPLDDVPPGPEPEDAVRTFLFRAGRIEAHASDWTETVSPLLLDGTELVALKGFQRALQQGLTRSMSELSIEVAFDLTNSTMQYSREGTPETGYVVRAVPPGGAATVTFFVDRENGAWRILAAFNDYSSVARRVLALTDEGKVDPARIWLDRVRKEVHAGGGDDPLSGNPFARIWEQGQEASPNQIRTAAAALIADTVNGWKVATPILENAAKTGAGTSSEFVSMALIQAFVMGKDPKARPLAEQLLKAHPRSVTALTMNFQAAFIAGGIKEAESVLDANLARFDQDLDALRAIASTAMVYGDTDRSVALTQHIIDAGQANAEDFNRIAWSQLMASKVTQATLELSNRGMLLASNNSTGLMHTLAAVDAELGREGDARQTLLQRMTAQGGGEPEDDDWYVFGRIAEQFGLNDAARSMYSKLQRPPNELMVPVSSYGLAQRRLRVLDLKQ